MKLLGTLGQVLGRQRAHDELAVVVQAYPSAAGGKYGLDGLHRGAQLLPQLVQAGPAVCRESGQLAQLGPKRRPAAGREEVAGRVGVAPGAFDPHVSRPQGVSQHVEHHQLPVVAVSSAAAVLGGLEVVTPAGGHEVGRGIAGHPAPAAGVEPLQDLDGFEQLGRLRAPTQGQGGQHPRGELPQASVAGLQQLQVPGVAPGPPIGGQTCLAQRVHADPAPQEPADSLVRHTRVGQDRQQPVQEHLPMLGLLGPLRQPLVELVAGTGVGGGKSLVEEQHQLVENLDRRLGQGGKQDRVSALGIGAGQSLGGGPASHLGEQPPPALGKRRQIEGVGVQGPQVGELIQLGLDDLGSG